MPVALGLLPALMLRAEEPTWLYALHSKNSLFL